MPRGRGHSPNTSLKVENAVLFVKAMHNGKRYSATQVRAYLVRHQKALYLTGEHIPKKRTIERIISNNADKIGIIKSKIKDNPLDKAWTIGACAEYSEYFTPESIPILVEYIQYLKSDLPENSLVDFTRKIRLEIYDLSIRDSIWLIRLKSLIEKYFANDITANKELLMSLPILIACTYAEAELSNEVTGKEEFDTSDMDNALISGDIQAFTEISEAILEAIYFSYRKEDKL